MQPFNVWLKRSLNEYRQRTRFRSDEILIIFVIYELYQMFFVKPGLSLDPLVRVFLTSVQKSRKKIEPPHQIISHTGNPEKESKKNQETNSTTKRSALLSNPRKEPF